MKKYIYRMVAIFSVLAMFIGIWKILRYMINDDIGSYTRTMMHEYYNQNNIDVIFAGASLCYRSFDTSVLDEGLRATTFNLGSSSQDLDATYYLIKDAVKRYDVDRVYLELSPIMALNMNENREMIGTYLVADHMHPSLDKLIYLLKASKPDHYADSFLVARRDWEKILDLDHVGAILRGKSDDKYKDYAYENLIFDTEYYAGKGYVAAKSRVAEHSFNDVYGSYAPLEVDKISEEWFNYLHKIITCCKDEGVEIVLVCVPLSEYLLVAYDRYDEYHKLVEKIASDEGIIFWDFNLCKKEYFSGMASYYQDSAHLNLYGAKEFSKLFADLATGKYNYEDICYKSVKDKLDDFEPNICGVVRYPTYMEIIADHKERLLFKVIDIPDNGEEILIQDFSHDIEFEINLEGHGRMVITAKDIDDPDKRMVTEITY